MPAKKQRGRGVADDIKKFVKDNKLVSRGLALVPIPGAGLASGAANLLGWGHRKKKKKVNMMRGSGIFSDIGGGLGSLAGGIGGGLGSLAHGLFGSGHKHRKNLCHM